MRPAPSSSLIPAFVDKHRDQLLCVAITLLAAMLRLWDLGGIPAGIHGDEAQVGLDAHRVLKEGWIGPYTWSALGQPAGHAYLTAPFLWLFGDHAWSLRLPLALTGIAAVPLTYVLFRMMTSRVEASVAAFLLATSLWHLHYSRIAHWPISYGTVALLVLILWWLAIRTERWYWFAASGLVLGLGLYTYNIYPMFVVAFAVFVALYTWLHKRDGDFKPWANHVALAAVVSLVVALPMIFFVIDPANRYFDHYEQYYADYNVIRSAEFREGNLWDKLEVVTGQAETFIGAYAWQGLTDFVDGASPDGRPMLDAATLLLFVVGFGSAAWRWRRTPYLVALTLVLVVPLASIMQTQATYRGPLGLAPFVCFLAAQPVALAWRESQRWPETQRYLMRGGVGLLLLLVAYTNVQGYFDVWAKSEHFPEVYAATFKGAIEYVDSLPGEPHVYFLSDQFTINHDTRVYLAPDMQGEDRSIEFAGGRDLTIDRTQDAVFLLMNDYLEDDTLQLLRVMYPEGQEYVRHKPNGDIGFIVYKLPGIRVIPP